MLFMRKTALATIITFCVLFTITQYFISRQICEEQEYTRLHFDLSQRAAYELPSGAGRRVTSVSCRDLMEGSDEEVARAKSYMSGHKNPIKSDSQILREVESSCDVVAGWTNISQTSVKEELEFPIAFTFLVHRDAGQLVRLLQNIYKSQNAYCIYVDRKASKELHRIVRILSDCLPNVHVPNEVEDVTYGSFLRLDAELTCMKLLLAKEKTWKYVINLTGQMFPLKTNLEIAKILQTLQGSNDIEGLSKWHLQGVERRFKTKHAILRGKMRNTNEAYVPPPHNIQLVKGSAYVACTREFIHYVNTSPIVQDFLDWCKHVYSPDELFWSTVNSRWVNPIFLSPGGHDASPDRKPWIAAHVAWKGKDQCAGSFVRNICVFGVADLPRLVHRPELFANKFYYDYEHLTIDCLEEWLLNKTYIRLPIDLEYYREHKRLLDYKN